MGRGLREGLATLFLDYVDHMSYTNYSVCGPHKLMPYSKKYPTLGNTIKMRFPESCSKHLNMIVDEYERIAKVKGVEFLDHIQRRLEDTLTNIG